MVSLYESYDITIETLSPEQTLHFNQILNTLKARLKLEGINQALLDLEYDGINNPLPFPELHWDIVACWMLLDGTIPPPIQLNNGDMVDYQTILLKDQPTLARWRKKLDYAKTGFMGCV